LEAHGEESFPGDPTKDFDPLPGGAAVTARLKWAGGLVAALLFCSACSGGGDGDKLADKLPQDGRPADGAPQAGPRYGGPQLPGLSAKPVWSAPGPGTQPDSKGSPQTAPLTRVALGDAVALATPESPMSWDLDVVEVKQRVDVRDIASGKVRTSFTVRGEVFTQTWQGRPVLVSQGLEETKSDGASKAGINWVLEAYDVEGTKLGRIEIPEREQFSMDGGMVLRGDGTADEPLTATPIAAPDEPVRLDCSWNRDLACAPAQQKGKGWISSNNRAPVRSVFADRLFVVEGSFTQRAPEGGQRIVALDAATGARTWTTQSLQRPEGFDRSAEHAVRVLGLAGDKLVIAWKLDRKTAAPDDWALTLHDPATGVQTGAGPRFPALSPHGKPLTSLLANSDGTIGIVDADGDVAFDVRTGALLWVQEGGNFNAAAVIGTVAYGGSEPVLALNARTREVLLPDTSLTHAPLPVGDKYAVARDANGVHCFEIKP